jgi:hypothetical protein
VSPSNIEMLELAASLLADIGDRDLVFVGGATIALWSTDPAAFDFRPTDDVDAIVEASSRAEYYRFEERLRGLGFVNDREVICRFRHQEHALVLDAMPTDPAILGFENRWLRDAFPCAASVALPSGRAILAATPPSLVATKLEAFRSRGRNDLLWSRDFEDVITLIDRREELVAEIRGAAPELLSYLKAELGDLARRDDFDSAAEGALGGGPETEARFERVVKPRIEAILGR